MCAKFLIAHPDAFTTRALEIALRDEHHNARVTREGLDAIDRALDEKPDAIILGIDLPGLNGLDVARALRALEPTREIPILFLARDSEEAATVSQLGLPLVDCMVGAVELLSVREHADKLLRVKLPAPAVRALDPDGHLAAISDPLTQLYERHYLLHRLAYEAARSARYSIKLTCILFSVDRFETITDELGTLERDRVLVEIANLFRRAARVSDVIGRTGDDQFLVLAPHTNEAGARNYATRVRQLIRDHSFNLPNKTVVSASVGVASAPGTSLADNLALIARAEVALNQARTDDKGVVVG